MPNDYNNHSVANSQQQVADEMLAFLESTPLSSELGENKNKDFLFHFEAKRALIVRDMLIKAGISPEDKFEMLDFGYLHGLTQEFAHRFFPHCKITVCDLPSSPIFADATYLNAIHSRGYLKLIPCNINNLDESEAKYQVVVLGEIIEHLDPTQVAAALNKLRKVVKPGGVLIVTTPNGSGLYNCYMLMTGGDMVQHPPIPDTTHGYPHIHLWSPKLLQQTAEHFGWAFKDLTYYHGREGEKFSEVRKAWGSLKSQILIRAIELIGNRKPKLMGFFVASFVAPKVNK